MRAVLGRTYAEGACSPLLANSFKCFHVPLYVLSFRLLVKGPVLGRYGDSYVTRVQSCCDSVKDVWGHSMWRRGRPEG